MPSAKKRSLERELRSCEEMVYPYYTTAETKANAARLDHLAQQQGGHVDGEEDEEDEETEIPNSDDDPDDDQGDIVDRTLGLVHPELLIALASQAEAVSMSPNETSSNPVEDEDEGGDEGEDEDEDQDDSVPSSPGVDHSRPIQYIRNCPATTHPLAVDDEAGIPAKTRATYARLFEEKGMLSMVHHALRTDRSDAKTFKGADPEIILFTGYQILAETHPKILKGVCSGELMHESFRDPELQDILQTMRIRSCDDRFPQPAIYEQVFADDNGKSPTPNDILRALDDMDKYCDTRIHFAGALRIDRYSNPKLSEHQGAYSGRKYLTDSNGNISPKAVKSVRQFSRAVRKRMMAIPLASRDDPLKCPFVEFGYTHKSAQRFKCHKRHRCSNYIMNLFEAIVDTHRPDVFRIRQFVIFLCTNACQAVVAEVLFTRLGQGYIGNGCGFSHYPAGRSNASARKYNENDWQRFFVWTQENINPFENHHLEMLKWAAVKERNKQAEEICQQLRERGIDPERLDEDFVRVMEATEAEAEMAWEALNEELEEVHRLADGAMDICQRIKALRESEEANTTSE